MKYLLLGLFLVGCSGKCVQTDTVKTLGQCSYSKFGDVGSSTCVAITESGHKVKSSEPFVIGENVCVK